MIDIETLGTGSDAAMLSIAAVPFSFKGISSDFNISMIAKRDAFYKHVNVQSCLDAGLKVTGGTIMWWLEQSHNARHSTIEGQHKSVVLEMVLKNLTNWFIDNKLENSIVWANSPSFDMNIIATAYEKFNMQYPWKYYNEMDCRSVYRLYKDTLDNASLNFTGTAHNPVDDCINQIKKLKIIYDEA